jgi:cysteine-rich repeat protein
VNSYTTGIQRANEWQALAVDRTGGFVVAWFSTQPEDTDGGVFARRFDAGGAPLGTEFRVDASPTGVQYEGVVSADADGDFVVAWRSDLNVDGDDYGIAGRVFRDPCGDGLVGAGESCDEGDRLAGDCCSPACEFESAGTACDADGVGCTPDGCDGAGACAAGVPDDTACPVCHVCDATAGCLAGPAGGACDADGVACTPDACDGAGACAAGVPDHDACPPCRVCDPAAGCVARPRTDCRRPTRARAATLELANRSSDGRDRASFSWRRGDAISLADFGTPTTSTAWDVCIFDRTGGADRLVLDARAAGGSGWKTRGKKGFRYRRKDGAPDGLTLVDLRSGAAGKAQATAEGKGAALALSDFPLSPPLTAQIQAGNGGTCAAATFGAPKKNTATRVRARGE